MAFGATYTVTINAVAKVLNRIKDGDFFSEYRLLETTGMWGVFIKHSEYVNATTKETYYRHNLELRHTLYANGTTPERVRRSYLVYDVPRADSLVEVGYVVAEFGNVADNATAQADLLNLLS